MIFQKSLSSHILFRKENEYGYFFSKNYLQIKIWATGPAQWTDTIYKNKKFTSFLHAYKSSQKNFWPRPGSLKAFFNLITIYPIIRCRVFIFPDDAIIRCASLATRLLCTIPLPPPPVWGVQTSLMVRCPASSSYKKTFGDTTPPI